MTTKITISAKRDSTVQTILLEILKQFNPEKIQEIHVIEYEQNENKAVDGSQATPKRYAINPSSVKNFLGHKGKAAADTTNNVGYQEIAQMERQISIPYLHVDIENGKLKWPEFEVRDKNEIREKFLELNKKGFASKKRMERIGIKCKDISVAPEIAAQIKILKDILDAPKDTHKDVAIETMYSLIAKREREILMYNKRQNVKHKRSYDETLLAQIEIMLWVLNNNYPFSKSNDFTLASYRIDNEPRS